MIPIPSALCFFFPLREIESAPVSEMKSAHCKKGHVCTEIAGGVWKQKQIVYAFTSIMNEDNIWDSNLHFAASEEPPRAVGCNLES